MNVRTKGLLDAALRRSPAQPVFHWRASRRLAVLAYHGIDDPERFGEQLGHLRRTANAVTLEEVLCSFEGRGSLPRRPVLITFDDGHRSVLEIGLPMLRDRGLPAAVFVVAGLIDTHRPFWWTEVEDLAGAGGAVAELRGLSPPDLVRALKRVPDERRRDAIEELRRTAPRPADPMPQLRAEDLRTLESGGVAVASHSWSHPCLSRCEDDVCRSEVVDAHSLLSGLLGHAPEAFAYPDGDRDARAAALLRELGYRAGFLFDHRLGTSSPVDPYAVSRLRVDSTATLDRFSTIVSGLHPMLHRARGGA